jgi:hypothetical protein
MFAALILLVIVAVVWCFIDLSKDASKIYKGLDALEAKAKGISGRAELLVLRNELTAFYKANCWHRHHAARAREVQAFIDGKLAATP